jgi:putative ABC transport system permease protein
VLLNYLKLAYKVLLRRKFFTFVSLFGISITLTVLFVVVAMIDTMITPGGRGSKLSRSLFIDEISLLSEDRSLSSNPSYYLLDRHVRTLTTPEKVSIHKSNRSTTVYVGGRKLQLDLKYTDAEFWEIAEFDFLEGGPYGHREVDNADAVAVITDRVRDEAFGAGPAVGHYVETTSGSFRVVGVVPGNKMPGEVVAADIWVPITQSHMTITGTKPYGAERAIVLPAKPEDAMAIKREFERHLDAVRAEVAGQFDSVACAMVTPFEMATSNIGHYDPGSATLAIAALIGLMVLFMLLPAMNLMNMNMSRIFERASEIGVRKAFGASVPTLVLQFIIENVILTLAGGILAVILSLTTLEILNSSGMVPLAHFTLNLQVLFYSLIVCVFFGVFSGVWPAYRMSRLHPVEALRGVSV